MELQTKIELLSKLGAYIKEDSEHKKQVLLQTEQHNKWITQPNSSKALDSFSDHFLNREVLENWLKDYVDKIAATQSKNIGLVLAGNIPAVGFHDVLCTFVSGHKAKIKLSEKDRFLLPFMIDYLIELDERCSSFFEFVPKLNDFDAVIATGSNSSSLYFEQYFSKYPHIIRKSRQSVAILNGEESEEDLLALGIDIFRFFGLGCRSVSKLYVPKGYDFNDFMRVMDHYNHIMDHHKYRNNFEYNRSIYLLNKVEHLVNNCLMVMENPDLVSRISTLHFEFYESKDALLSKLNAKKDQIQCIASNMTFKELSCVPLGQTQSPKLQDYADNVNTLEFLLNLN